VVAASGVVFAAMPGAVKIRCGEPRRAGSLGAVAQAAGCYHL